MSTVTIRGTEPNRSERESEKIERATPEREIKLKQQSPI
jgi:hypothetical protein